MSTVATPEQFSFDDLAKLKESMRIVQAVRDSMLRGLLKAGDFIATEQQVDRGLGKHALRDAFTILQYLGLVERRSEIGFFVAATDLSYSQALMFNQVCFYRITPQHLSDLRRALEPYAVRMVAPRLTRDQLGELVELTRLTRLHIERGEYNGIDYFAVQFHKVIAQLSDNPLLMFILTFVENLLHELKQAVGIDKEFANDMFNGHVAIVNALVEKDVDRAADAMYRDISRVEEHLIRNIKLRLDRAGKDSSDSSQDYLDALDIRQYLRPVDRRGSRK